MSFGTGSRGLLLVAALVWMAAPSAAAEDHAAPAAAPAALLTSWTPSVDVAAPRLSRRTSSPFLMTGPGARPPAWFQADGATPGPESQAGAGGPASGEDLAKKAQNPVSNMISLPFQNNTNFGIGPYDRTQNVTNIQPVVPISISRKWNLITRTIIPLIRQPHIESSDGSTFGLGDLNPTVFLTPAKPGKIIWGAGASVFLPTATDRRLGTGKFSVGPSAVLVAMPGDFVTGVLVQNYWSFAGESDRQDVHAFLTQFFINYNIPGGWYFTTSPIITANWKAPTGERWTIPVGGGIGRVMKFGRQPVNLTAQAYYNLERPTIAPDWQVRLQMTFLFPVK